MLAHIFCDATSLTYKQIQSQVGDSDFDYDAGDERSPQLLSSSTIRLSVLILKLQILQLL